MPTEVFTLTEFTEELADLAEDWDGEEPVVLVGDVHGQLDVSAKDGYTQHGSVGYAHEVFGGNGTLELGQKSDRRFYGTMLFDPADLSEDVQEYMAEQTAVPAGGDD